MCVIEKEKCCFIAEKHIFSLERMSFCDRKTYGFKGGGLESGGTRFDSRCVRVLFCMIFGHDGGSLSLSLGHVGNGFGVF